MALKGTIRTEMDRKICNVSVYALAECSSLSLRPSRLQDWEEKLMEWGARTWTLRNCLIRVLIWIGPNLGLLRVKPYVPGYESRMGFGEKWATFSGAYFIVCYGFFFNKSPLYSELAAERRTARMEKICEMNGKNSNAPFNNFSAQKPLSSGFLLVRFVFDRSRSNCAFGDCKSGNWERAFVSPCDNLIIRMLHAGCLYKCLFVPHAFHLATFLNSTTYRPEKFFFATQSFF